MMSEGSYWSEEGMYQEEYDLIQKLIPSEGHAQNNQVDLVRMASNIYYDVFNNGGCNLHLPRFQIYIDTLEHEHIDMDLINELSDSFEPTDERDEDDELIYPAEPDFDECCQRMDEIMDELMSKIDEDILEEARKEVDLTTV